MSQATAERMLTTNAPALRLVTSPRIPRRIAKGLVVMLVAAMAALLLAPWQQSIRGNGQVVAYAPLERQQTAQATIDGIVFEWKEGIREGAEVVKDQPIVELRDFDPSALERWQFQRDAAAEKLKFAEQAAVAYKEKFSAIEAAQQLAIDAAEQEVEMARQKIEAERQGREGAAAAEIQAKAFLDRQRQLLAAELVSPQDVEIALKSHKESQAKLRQSEAYVSSAESALAAKIAQLEQKRREATGYIEAARAEYQKAEGEASLARKDLAEVESKLASQQRQIITAPRNGTIVRLLVNQGGEIVKKGDPLFILVPESAERAVELYVSGNDTPLVTTGRHVRLQFEGWPAVQFAGWPSVAIGTFGGTVVNIDATDSGNGQFRLLVRPDEDSDWPDDRYLRQGVRANGWVLLNQVTLGYELWRQMNGFPPVVSPQEPKESEKGGKDVKKPKIKL